MTQIAVAIFIAFFGLNIYLAVYLLKIRRTLKISKKVPPTAQQSVAYPIRAYESQELKYEAEFNELDIDRIRAQIKDKYGEIPYAEAALVEDALRSRFIVGFCKELSTNPGLFNITISKSQHGNPNSLYARATLYVLLNKC